MPLIIVLSVSSFSTQTVLALGVGLRASVVRIGSYKRFPTLCYDSGSREITPVLGCTVAT